MTRLHFVVSGRVQGVGYRWFVRDNARRLGLTGWVRNLSDQTVELEAQGDARALEELDRLLKTGHPGARVDGIVRSPEKPRAGEEGFEIT